jgi:hypothetical protein
MREGRSALPTTSRGEPLPIFVTTFLAAAIEVSQGVPSMSMTTSPSDPGQASASAEPDPDDAAEIIAGGPLTSEGPGSPRPARNAIIAAVALCLIVSAFFLSFCAALGQPTVRDMTIAVSAPAPIVTSLQAAGGLHPRPVADAAAARAAVLHRRADGAIVIQHGTHLTTYVAAGGGRAADLALTAIGQHLAGQLGTTARVQDLAPLAPGDPSGIIGFYSIVFLTIGASFGATVMGRILGTVRRPVQLLERTITLLAYTSLLAAVVTGLAGGALHALVGSPAQVFLVLWAYTLAVGGAVTGVAAAFGTTASLALIILVVIVGNPSSGGPVGPALLPPFFRTLSPYIPQGGGLWLLRDVLYFGSHELTRGAACLLAWGGSGLLLASLAVLCREITNRRTARNSAGTEG